MSVAVKSVHPRRIKPKVPRPDIFYIYDEDANSTDSNKSDKNKCASNGTQTKNDHRLRTPHTLQKCVIPRKKLKKKNVKIMDWKKYHRLNVIYSFIDNLEKDYPAICTVTVIGKSVEGRDIKMLKVSNSNANNLGVWLDACIHPREWITTAVVTYIANELVRNFHKFSNAVTRFGIDWKNFYPLSSIYEFLAELETTYPSTCTVSVIGRTVEGRDIKMLKISNSNAENTAVWIDGTTHAREWITTSVVTYIADHIARHFDTLRPCFTNKDWYILPVVNPDGYHHSHTADRMWRKNRAVHGNIITGVDINRNFGYFWGRGGNDGSSNDPYHINYRGVEAFSEPETVAIKDIILYSGTPFKIFLTFHAYSEAIAFPWCHVAEPCADYVTLLEGGTAMAKAIFETSGRMYKVGNFKDIMYNATGTSIDWSYGTARIPYSYLVELRSKQDKFLLPKDEILICCQEVLNGVKALVKFVDKTRCTNCVVNAKKLRV